MATKKTLTPDERNRIVQLIREMQEDVRQIRQLVEERLGRRER